jgi:hypothetical protein
MPVLANQTRDLQPANRPDHCTGVDAKQPGNPSKARIAPASLPIEMFEQGRGNATVVLGEAAHKAERFEPQEGVEWTYRHRRALPMECASVSHAKQIQEIVMLVHRDASSRIAMPVANISPQNRSRFHVKLMAIDAISVP